MKNKQGTDAHDELREIAPGLNQMRRDDGFTVPPNYFRELPDRVFVRIEAEQRQSQKAKSWLWDFLSGKGRVGLRPVLAFATVLILIAAGIWFGRPHASQDVLASVTQTEALDYVLDNLDDYSSDDILMAGALSGWDATELAPMSDDNLDNIMDDILDDETLLNDLMIN